jgi:GDP-L-fucose synthase
MKILLTGGNGMVGQAIKRSAEKLHPEWDIYSFSSREFDLTNQQNVRDLFTKNSFDLVIHAAAKVGVKNFINIGSSCMYPKDLGKTLIEEDIFTAPFEPTNEGYAIAKIATAKLCAFMSDQFGINYRTFIPCNLYGIGDTFHARNSHLIPAIIMKIHNAKVNNLPTVEIWGDGSPLREFLYVDDLADFIIQSADKLENLPSVLNTGYGSDYSVNNVYEMVAKVIGYVGNFTHKLDAPMGMKKKLMDSSLAKTHGWSPQTTLEDGLVNAYQYYLSQQK